MTGRHTYPIRKTLLRWVAACALAVALLTRPAFAEPVTVFAAASLKTALDALAADFEGDLTLSYGGSSALARQVQYGAPADVVFLANTDWMDFLEDGSLIDPATRRDALANRLVLVGGTDAKSIEIGPDMDLAGYLGDGRLAMALVDAVPAGIYGKAALISLNQWQTVAPKVAQVDNVRAALALVSLGQVPLGVVYETDARAELRVKALGIFPENSHPPIRYPVAAVAGRTQHASGFLEFLTSDKARAALAAQGFIVLDN